MELIKDLQTAIGTAVVLVTHDLGVVAGTTDRVAVMYAGRIVEEGTTAEVFANPQHPYTRGLLESMPPSIPRFKRRFMLFLAYHLI